MVESSRLSNATFLNIHDPEIVVILEKYFSKSIISMGALSRKMPFLLLELAQFTKNKWCARGEYNESDKVFTVTLSGKADERIVIVNKPSTKSGISNVFSIVNQLFSKDKWVPYSVVSSTVLLKKTRGWFLYSKERYRSKETLFYFEVKPEATPLMDKIKGLFSHTKSDEIVGHEIISCSKHWNDPAA